MGPLEHKHSGLGTFIFTYTDGQAIEKLFVRLNELGDRVPLCNLHRNRSVCG